MLKGNLLSGKEKVKTRNKKNNLTTRGKYIVKIADQPLKSQCENN